MSIGNLKTDGGKGTNWPWQYRVLLGLDKIAQTLKDGTEFESELVTIDCSGNPSPPPSGSDIIRLEVRVWDTELGEFTSVQLYEVGSATPDLTDYSGCTKTYLSGDATEATLQALLAVNTDIKSNTDSLVDSTNTPTVIRTSASAVVTITLAIKSVSFYNASPTNNAHVNTIDLKPGETMNFDAGGNGNKFSGSVFTYDADPDASGAGDLLIIYVE